jgi:hypothetical protein
MLANKDPQEYQESHAWMDVQDSLDYLDCQDLRDQKVKVVLQVRKVLKVYRVRQVRKGQLVNLVEREIQEILDCLAITESQERKVSQDQLVNLDYLEYRDNQVTFFPPMGLN